MIANRIGADDDQLRRPPLVFVSYAHDSDEHKQHVLQFATLLRDLGIDAHIDQWYDDQRRDWFAWADNQITRADFVIVIASPRYRAAGDGNAPSDRNRGVQSESALLRDLLHRQRNEWLPKLLPVILPGHTVDEIPNFLQPYCADHYVVTDLTVDGVDDLQRVLTGQPRRTLPPLGPLHMRPPMMSQPGGKAVTTGGDRWWHEDGKQRQRRRLGQEPSVFRLDNIASQLAETVKAHREGEEERHGAHGPNVLEVRWHPVAEHLRDDWGNINSAGRAEPLDLTGSLADILQVYNRVPSGRLLVLGAAGSGKTVLALRLIRGLLDDYPRRSRIPMIFSLGSWDPTITPLRDWLADQLVRDMPGLDARDATGSTLAGALVDTGRILPILDGFDEIAAGLRNAALSALNGTAMPLVLTSRPEEYEMAATSSAVLRFAAGVKLDALTIDDLEYLPRTTRKTTTNGGMTCNVWRPVLTALREHPRSHSAENLLHVLSTPLMVALARTSYSDTPDRDPIDLLDIIKFPSTGTLEEHLLDAFVPTVYRPPLKKHIATRGNRRRWDPVHAQHWLGYLAWHLDQLNSVDLAWWEIGRTLSRPKRGLLLGLATGALTWLGIGAPASLLIGDVTPLFSGLAVCMVIMIGFGVGAAVGFGRGLVFGAMTGLVVGPTLSFGLGHIYALATQVSLGAGIALTLVFMLIYRAACGADPKPSHVQLGAPPLPAVRKLTRFCLTGGVGFGILVAYRYWRIREDKASIESTIAEEVIYGVGAGIVLGAALSVILPFKEMNSIRKGVRLRLRPRVLHSIPYGLFVGALLTIGYCARGISGKHVTIPGAIMSGVVGLVASTIIILGFDLPFARTWKERRSARTKRPSQPFQQSKGLQSLLWYWAFGGIVAVAIRLHEHLTDRQATGLASLASLVLNIAVSIVVFGSVVGGLVWICVRLTIRIIQGFEAPVDITGAVNPARILTIDRNNAIFQTVVITLILSISFWTIYGLTKPSDPSVAIVWIMLILFLVVPVASRKAWGRWLIFARVWLPLAGKLPWALHAFLDDAVQRGVLRQTGAVYQFRHSRLQNHLVKIYQAHLAAASASSSN